MVELMGAGGRAKPWYWHVWTDQEDEAGKLHVPRQLGD